MNSVGLPPEKLFDFSDQVVVVTGAGRGIGAGVALRFAQAGAAVVLGYRSSEAGAKSVVESIVAGGGRAFAVRANMTKREDAQRLVEEAVLECGKVDVMVNAAGIYPRAALIDMSDASWQEVIDSNLRTAFLGTQIVARHMAQRGQGGAIVNIASIEADAPAAEHSHYCAAKAGVVMYTATAAHELGPLGIRVNVVSPGLIWNNEATLHSSRLARSWQETAPLRRVGGTTDVADACLFLASRAASWITGTNLRVDGGMGAGR